MTAPVAAGAVVWARTEREVAADAVWALIDSGVIPRGTPMARIVGPTGLTVDDLLDARYRAERRAAPTPAADRPTRTDMPPERTGPGRPRGGGGVDRRAYDREPPPAPGDLAPVTRLHPRARRAVAEAIFAQWKATGNLECSRCGGPLCSGETVEVESAHHAGRCP